MTDARIVATNPADSSVVPVACNENGELLLAETSLDQFVEKDGDTMTGNLHMGDKIILNPDGSAQFADGAVDVYTSGKVELSDDVYLDGELAFQPQGSLPSTSGTVTGIRINPSGGSGFFTYGGSIRVYGPQDGTGLYNQKLVELYNDGSITCTGTINAGSTIFSTGRVIAGNSFSSTATDRAGADLRGYGSGDWGQLSLQSKQGASANTPVFRVYHGNNSNVYIKSSGEAAFGGNVFISSRGSLWKIVESGGIAHLEAVTRSSDEAEPLGLEEIENQPDPVLRNLPQEIDQLRSVVTALLTEVQRVEEKLRMAPESGWPVWDGSD